MLSCTFQTIADDEDDDSHHTNKVELLLLIRQYRTRLGARPIQGSFFAVARLEGNALGGSNIEDQKTDNALGDNISNTVSQLNGNNGRITGQTKHGEQINNGVTVIERSQTDENQFSGRVVVVITEWP